MAPGAVPVSYSVWQSLKHALCMFPNLHKLRPKDRKLMVEGENETEASPRCSYHRAFGQATSCSNSVLLPAFSPFVSGLSKGTELNKIFCVTSGQPLPLLNYQLEENWWVAYTLRAPEFKISSFPIPGFSHCEVILSRNEKVNM